MESGHHHIRCIVARNFLSKRSFSSFHGRILAPSADGGQLSSGIIVQEPKPLYLIGFQGLTLLSFRWEAPSSPSPNGDLTSICAPVPPQKGLGLVAGLDDT